MAVVACEMPNLLGMMRSQITWICWAEAGVKDYSAAFQLLDSRFIIVKNNDPQIVRVLVPAIVFSPLRHYLLL
jgi:hypothetical protein